VTELQLREFGPVALPAYGDTTAEVRSVTDVYVPQIRLAATEGSDAKPSWLLGDDEEPYWKLQRRKENHGRTPARTT
jgi:hypothetical protein